MSGWVSAGLSVLKLSSGCINRDSGHVGETELFPACVKMFNQIYGAHSGHAEDRTASRKPINQGNCDVSDNSQ